MTPTKIIIDEKWLKTCGKHHLIGKALEILRVEDFGEGKKFYTVKIDFGTQWKVWEQRGITLL